MLFIIPIIIALLAGCYLLALVSDGFAYELSRGVERAFDFIEYRAALRQSRREEIGRLERVAYRTSLTW